MVSFIREETGLMEKTTDLSQVTDKLYHIMFIEYTSPWEGLELTTLVVVDTDCTGSYTSNYHRTTTMTAPSKKVYGCKWTWKTTQLYLLFYFSY